jgi:hypothetical protein
MEGALGFLSTLPMNVWSTATPYHHANALPKPTALTTPMAIDVAVKKEFAIPTKLGPALLLSAGRTARQTVRRPVRAEPDCVCGEVWSGVESLARDHAD